MFAIFHEGQALLAEEHPEFLDLARAEADGIAKASSATSVADLMRMAQIADGLAEAFEAAGNADAAATGRVFAAMFRERARQLRLH